MIFPVLFYKGQEGGNPATISFDEAIYDSLFTDKSWPGMACDLGNIGDCIVRPEQFGIDIFPAYVFLRRVGNGEDGVMVKRIEGRELSREEILSEIADAAEAEFEEDGSGVIDLDGDGKNDVVALPSKYGLLGFGRPINSLFDCGSYLPHWMCRMRIGYLFFFILLVVVLVVAIRKL